VLVRVNGLGTPWHAADMAARGDFAVVGVVMDGTAGHLYAALKALRKGTRARIVLLAQMHEEPIARRLVDHTELLGQLATRSRDFR